MGQAKHLSAAPDQSQNEGQERWGQGRAVIIMGYTLHQRGRTPSIDEIWYPDIDHGLAGAERQTADDLSAGLKKIGML